jgi:NitT/TauT family transport system ATP-binding protein
MEVRHLAKTYGSGSAAKEAIADLTFEVARGEFVCVIGPSGCGKTTLLRCLAGLLPPTSGEAIFEGEPINEPAEKLALVFQDYSRSLLPSMSVEENIALPLRHKGLTRTERSARAREMLAAVSLVGVENSFPWQLSGGMQQRVAIARALAYQPDALLMDEPFASVDAQTRCDLEDLVLDLRREFGVTIVLVTHDIDEAVYLADRVVVLSNSPCVVREIIPTDLGPARDQVTTKADPRFAELRSRLFKLLKRDNS